MGDRLRCLICLGYFIINLFASIYFNGHSQERLIYENHFFFFLKGLLYAASNLLCLIAVAAPPAQPPPSPFVLSCPPQTKLRQPSWFS